MSSGMRIWGPNGSLQLDENSFTVRVVHSSLVTRVQEQTIVTRNVFISIPEVTVQNYTAVCLPNGPYTGDASTQDPRVSQFDAQVVNGGVYVWFCNRNRPNTSTIGVGTQRLLVMRHR